MSIRLLSTVTALLLFAVPTVAQDHKGDKQPAEAGGMPMPKPGPEHMQLAKAEGTWDMKIESTGMPASTGKAEMKMTLNGFWLTEKVTASFAGMPFEGQSVTGYDSTKGKYVSTWIDSMSPSMMVMEGTFDAKTKTLTMVGDGVDMMGQKCKTRNLTIHKDANTVVFEMYQTGGDGKENKMMTITYTRHGAAPAK